MFRRFGYSNAYLPRASSSAAPECIFRSTFYPALRNDRFDRSRKGIGVRSTPRPRPVPIQRLFAGLTFAKMVAAMPDMPCLSCTSPQAADVKHALNQGALDQNALWMVVRIRVKMAQRKKLA
jgi:hypothetical protein